MIFQIDTAYSYVFSYKLYYTIYLLHNLALFHTKISKTIRPLKIEL